MAKKNKQRKKRLKKYFKKLAKQANKQPQTPAIYESILVQDKYYPPYKEPIVLNIHEEYEAQKRFYQSQLNEKYGGTVTAIETFVNQQSIILHKCSECSKEFYALPEWLLSKPNQQHICGVNTTRMDAKKLKKAKKRLTEHDIIRMIVMAESGMSMTHIANKLGVTRPTVISHLRKAEVK